MDSRIDWLSSVIVISSALFVKSGVFWKVTGTVSDPYGGIFSKFILWYLGIRNLEVTIRDLGFAKRFPIFLIIILPETLKWEK